MESESKLKVVEELESPEVGRDSVAGEISTQSTNGNDPVQPIDSPTETELSDTHAKEVASSPGRRMGSDVAEEEGSLAKAAPSAEKDVIEERTQSSSPEHITDVHAEVPIDRPASQSVEDGSQRSSKQNVPSDLASECESRGNDLNDTTVEVGLSESESAETFLGADEPDEVMKIVSSDSQSEGGTSSVDGCSRSSRSKDGESEDVQKDEHEKPSRDSEVTEGDPVGELCLELHATPGALSAKAASSCTIPSGPCVSRVSNIQLKRFYQWCNQGLCASEALEKAMTFKITPTIENPHPNCKLERVEIDEISMIIPDRKSRLRFVVETFFGGKDLEEQLKFCLTKTGTKRHPNCKHSWEDVKKMSTQFSKESSRWKFVINVYYKGKEPEEVIKTISNAPDCELSYLTYPELKKYCQWCGFGLSCSEALVKAKEPGEVPQAGAPHPECKLPLAEIREISMLVSERNKFLVETFSEGKDPEEVLKRMLSDSYIERHPRCSHSWEELKQMSTGLKKESLKWKFVVETYYKGQDTVEVLKLLDAKHDRRRFSGSIEQVKRYYKWCNLGLDDGEAFKKSKDPDLVPQTEDPHPDCKLTWKEIQQISSSIPAPRLGSAFEVETFFGGKDPEAQLKQSIRHQWETYSWEDLRRMASKLPTEYLKLKFLVETYGRRIKPEKVLRNLLSNGEPNDMHSTSGPVTANLTDQQNVDNSTLKKFSDGTIDETAKISKSVSGEPIDEPAKTSKNVSEEPIDDTAKISKLSLNQLKKYYKWCILGFSSSEALSKAKEPGLVPATEDRHPNCKLPWEEIKQIALLIPAKYPRAKFQIETFFGGKDPEEQLILMLASANTERHPSCKHNWEDLKKMSIELPKESMKFKFLVETFYGGKEPEELVKTMLQKNSGTSSSGTAKGSVDAQNVVASHEKDESTSESEISKLSLNQLKKFYKWRILGIGCSEAIVKAKEPGLIPQTEDPHPNCKLPFEEVKQMSLLIPLKHARTLFQVETFLGGKDPEEQLKQILSNSNTKRHPDCKNTWEELKKMSAAIPKESLRMKFIVDSFYGGKSPGELLKSMSSDANDSNPAVSATAVDVHLVDGTVKQTKKTGRFADCAEAAASSSAVRDSYEDPTIIDEGTIGALSNDKLKLYYLRRNAGFDHEIALSKASNFESYYGKHLSKSKLSLEEVNKMSEEFSETILRDRFFIHAYFGGKDPECTRKHIKSHPRKPHQPGDMLHKPDSVVHKPDSMMCEPDNVVRKRGSDVDKPANVVEKPGNVVHKTDNAVHKPGNVVNKPDSVVEPEGCSDETSSVVDDSPLSNGSLKYYFLWRNKGYDHEAARSRVKNRVPLNSTHYPHPSCMHSEDQLRYFSLALKSNRFRWDRFVIYTYYGGKDPESTLKYFMSHPGNVVDLPDEMAEGPWDKNFIFVETSVEGNRKLKRYYLWRNKGCTHETAMLKVNNEEDIVGKHLPHPNCKYTEDELREMSQVLRTKIPHQQNFQWDRFLIHTYYGGKDPQNTLKYFLSNVKKGGKSKSEPVLSPHKVKKKCPIPFEPVAKRTRSCRDPGNVPFDSPDHPSKELNIYQLKNYYSWISFGCSRGEAMINAKTPGLFPKKIRSRCLIPMKVLKSMSQQLPTEQLRKIFIVETYYGGNDPDEVMGYMLSRVALPEAGSVHKPPQKASQKPEPHQQHPSNHCHNNIENQPTDGEVRLNQESTESYNPTVLTEEVALRRLCDGELKYYYLWRNRGLDKESALANVKKRVKIPGKHLPHPNCKHREAELQKLSAALPFDVRERFFVHTYFGGKDPECAVRHFTSAPSSSSGNVNAHQAEFLGPNDPTLERFVPLVASPYEHPPVGPPGVQQSYQRPYFALPEVVPPIAYPHIGPPVEIVYPPDQFQSASAVITMGYPSYQQQVCGPPTVGYPPDVPQVAAPTLVHRPSVASGANSGYPHAGAAVHSPNQLTIPPPVAQHLRPPVAQQPPTPSLPGNSNTTTSTPQSHLPKGGEPLIGKHDPKQSSLRRKSSDELPIKIKFKSLSDPPKQPKQVCDEEEPPEVDRSTSVFIVPTIYPSQSLTDSQMDAIESNLLEAILEMDDDGTKPSFKDTCRNSGRYGITCVDKFSVNWLYKYLSTYQPWPGASLKLIDQTSKIRANAILPPCKGDDDKKILKYIERQNRGLNVSTWTVVQRWDNGDLNTCMDLIIDEKSADVLKKSSKISFKLGSAEIITSKNDAPPTSRITGPSKRRSPAANSPSRSSPPPPPPKCMRWGEGFPCPPKGSSKTDTALGSPSSSRGRPIPETHSSRSKSPLEGASSDGASEQKHSWMDWFYSKGPKKAASKSPCRDRSPSPQADRKTQFLKRERSRSDSRSLSPKYRGSAPRTSPDWYVEKASYSKKRRRADSTSSSSSDEYSSSRRCRVDSRPKRR